MKKTYKYFFMLLALVFVSCASVKVPVYNVEFEESQAINNIVNKKSLAEYKSERKKIRIVQISDFHSNDFGKEESYLIKKISDSKPDVIVMTGDIFDFEMKGEKPLGNVDKLLSGIKDICPIYYVCGNHEFYEGGIHEYESVLKKNGVVIVDDGVFSVEFPQGKILLAGISDPQSAVKAHPQIHSAEKKMLYRKRLNSLADETKSKLKDEDVIFTILLAHRPEFIEDYNSCGCFDLVLSGHAHGGQWRIPGLVNGLFAPGQGYFPKYAGGRYDFEKTSWDGRKTVFIVSRGLSHQAPNFPRFFNPLELVAVDVTIIEKQD